jgi:hypothetical protein
MPVGAGLEIGAALECERSMGVVGTDFDRSSKRWTGRRCGFASERHYW